MCSGYIVRGAMSLLCFSINTVMDVREGIILAIILYDPEENWEK